MGCLARGSHLNWIPKFRLQPQNVQVFVTKQYVGWLPGLLKEKKKSSSQENGKADLLLLWPQHSFLKSSLLLSVAGNPFLDLHLLGLSRLLPAEPRPTSLPLHFLSPPRVLCFLLFLSCLSCYSTLVRRKCLPLPSTKSLFTLLIYLLRGDFSPERPFSPPSPSRPAHTPAAAWPDPILPNRPCLDKCLSFDFPLKPTDWLTHSLIQRASFIILLYPPKHTS